MRISRDDMLGGIALVALRESFRHVRWRSFDLDEICESVGAPEAFAQVLRERGLVEPHSDGRWRLTLEGGSIANATLAKPVLRSTAQRALDGLIERASIINASDDYAFWVDELVLFGSFLDPTVDRVGDVDVAVTVTARHAGDDFGAALERRAAAAEAQGRQFPSIIDRLGWAETEVFRTLKNRSRVLSLTETDDRVLASDIARRVVYRRKAEDERSGNGI